MSHRSWHGGLRWILAASFLAFVSVWTITSLMQLVWPKLALMLGGTNALALPSTTWFFELATALALFSIGLRLLVLQVDNQHLALKSASQNHVGAAAVSWRLSLSHAIAAFVSACLLWATGPWAWRAWQRLESSANPDGLPWLFVLKAFVFFLFAMLLLASLGFLGTRCLGIGLRKSGSL